MKKIYQYYEKYRNFSNCISMRKNVKLQINGLQELFKTEGRQACENQIFKNDITWNVISQFTSFSDWKGKKKVNVIKAKQIALAKVPGATFANVLEFDTEDNGFYKGKINYRNVAYNFEIDIYTGKIINWSEEKSSNK